MHSPPPLSPAVLGGLRRWALPWCPTARSPRHNTPGPAESSAPRHQRSPLPRLIHSRRYVITVNKDRPGTLTAVVLLVVAQPGHGRLHRGIVGKSQK